MSFTENFKSLKLNEKGKAGIKTGDTWASLAGGDSSNFISADNTGVSVGGSVSFQSLSHQIKIGGLSKFNYWPLLFVPSTIFTPFPVLIPNLPIPKEMIKVAADLVRLSSIFFPG